MIFMAGTESWAAAFPSRPVAPTDQPTRYQTPEDMIDLLPVVGSIPRAFFWTGGYAVKLSIKEMRIDHMTAHSRCPMKRRGCTLALSYSQPIGQQLFSSTLDFPLLSSEAVTSHWSAATLGDYVLHLSNQPLPSRDFRLMASARF